MSLFEVRICISDEKHYLIGWPIFNALHDGEVFMLLLASADFFKINFFKKFFQEYYHSVK